jgi:hypothetical protein
MSLSNMPKEHNSFISYAAKILADTHYGLSGTQIVEYCNNYAIKNRVTIPLTTNESYRELKLSKYDLLLKNLQAFDDIQQVTFISELCNLPIFEKNDKIKKIKTMLIEIYTEPPIERDDKTILVEIESKMKLKVQPDITLLRPFMPIKKEEYDVFISHASEDKKGFVNEFVHELSNLGIKVWYDEQNIKWGDQIREEIDKGLSKSKFGIVIISPSYIADGKYWTKTEFNGLFQLDRYKGKMLLPIFHKITETEVMSYSPMIVGRRAMTTDSMTPKEIAEELLKLLNTIDENN